MPHPSVTIGLVSFLGSVVLAGAGSAQALGALESVACPAPDGLDGGDCCSAAPQFLPAFPDFTQPSLQICWRACSVDRAIPLRAVWSNLSVPGEIPCGERRVRLDLTNSTGALQWTGELRLQYSRTWLETDPDGSSLQVWRFLVNGDLEPVAAIPASPKMLLCQVPTCAQPHANQVRFTGYVDHAASCDAVPKDFQHAWMLTHAIDAIDHHAGFPRAGTFHPDRAYTFVGPRAGFVPGPVQPTEGTAGSFFEHLRARNMEPLTGPPTCQFEEQVDFSLFPEQQICLGGSGLGPLQYMTGDLSVDGCFTFVFEAFDPLLPGFVSMGIGSWTVPGTYPGIERLRWSAGSYDRTPHIIYGPCIALPTNVGEIFFGVTTIGGYPATQLTAAGPGAPLPLTFIDQSNSLAVGGPMNVPYVSSHFLGLNH